MLKTLLVRVNIKENLLVRIIFSNYLILICLANNLEALKWDDLKIPLEHTPFFFSNNPDVKEHCINDQYCPYRNLLHLRGCWGYEGHCSQESQYSTPSCPGDHRGWVRNKTEQINLFFSQGDFGYVRDRQKELTTICRPVQRSDSSLECVDYLRFCRGRNILINFDSLLTIEQPMRYRMDVLRKGQIGGNCKLDGSKLQKQLGHKSPLQSWAPELENFSEFDFHPIQKNNCDIIVDKPTFLLKLDATVNMYHHFCDFVNLYLSQHTNNSFSLDVNILIWDTIPYYSNFGVTWKAFTKHKVMDLGNFAGKKVCFRDVVFSFLPRMIFGMYYNMPLVDGCERSGFFKAFTQHVLYRLGVSQENSFGKIRITLLSRDTTYRKILNEDKLIKALAANRAFVVKKINFNHKMPFIEQLKVTHNTDIFIGIHGAGLTHLLFLPDWAVIFEIYNCEDDSCYRDLARLRGLKYVTWENEDKLMKEDEGHHPTMGAHAKFTNYAFDVEEFLRLVMMSANHVRNDYMWQQLNHGSRRHDEL